MVGSRPPCACGGQAGWARIGETRAGKGFTQKRFTEVQALRSDMQRSRVGPTPPTEVTHIISQALGVRHVELIMLDKKSRTKAKTTGAKDSKDFVNLAPRRLLQIRWWDLWLRFR